MFIVRRTFVLVSAVALAAWLGVPAYAQHQPVASEGAIHETSNINTLEAEVATLRAQLESLTTANSQGVPNGGPPTIAAYGGEAAPYGGCPGEACGVCGGGCCQPCFCCPPGFLAEGEVTFFRYHRADGMRIGEDFDENVEFDFEPAPRVTVGYADCSGRGVRARYWDYDHENLTFGEQATMAVDTYIVDLEVFGTFCLNPRWSIEVAAGVRYNEFNETMFDPGDVPGTIDDLRINDFSGYGGLASVQLATVLGCHSAVFVRTRCAILNGDKNVFNFDNGEVQNDVELLDTVQGMIELAMGYEFSIDVGRGATLYARAMAEWQYWLDYTSHFLLAGLPAPAAPEDFGVDDNFSGPANVGFAGVAFSVGIAR